MTTQKLWRLHLTQIAEFLVSLESLEALFVVHLFLGKARPDIDVQLTIGTEEQQNITTRNLTMRAATRSGLVGGQFGMSIFSGKVYEFGWCHSSSSGSSRQVWLFLVAGGVLREMKKTFDEYLTP